MRSAGHESRPLKMQLLPLQRSAQYSDYPGIQMLVLMPASPDRIYVIARFLSPSRSTQITLSVGTRAPAPVSYLPF